MPARVPDELKRKPFFLRLRDHERQLVRAAAATARERPSVWARDALLDAARRYEAEALRKATV